MKMTKPFVSCIIPSAGRGQRMQCSTNKNLLPILGKAVLLYSIETFCMVENVREILLLIKEEDKADIEKMLEEKSLKVPIRLIYGAGTRQGSVYNGLRNLNNKCDIVSIHDGARPLVSTQIIQRTIDAAMKYGASCASVSMKETVAIQKNGKIDHLLQRDTLASIQTPQTFEKDLICSAHQNALLRGFQSTDDTSLVQNYGHDVYLVKGSYENIKITTPEDFVLAKHLLLENYNRRQNYAD